MSNITLKTESGIHVVDFKPFMDGTDKQAVADAILTSFKNVGFVYLVNHPVPKEKIDSMFEWVGLFTHNQEFLRPILHSQRGSSTCLWKRK